jgi:alpha-glucuronidase
MLELRGAGDLPAELALAEAPKYALRVLDHWDNLDGTVMRGYAGHSIWKWAELPAQLSPRYEQYALANAVVGINDACLNNVNADRIGSPWTGDCVRPGCDASAVAVSA